MNCTLSNNTTVYTDASRDDAHGSRIYLVDIPSDFSPENRRSLPSGFRHIRDSTQAVKEAARLNQSILDDSVDGLVKVWNVVLCSGKGSGYGVVQIRLEREWRAGSAYDMPPAVATISRPAARRRVIRSINHRLDRDQGGPIRQRAYASVSDRFIRKAELHIRHLQR